MTTNRMYSLSNRFFRLYHILLICFLVCTNLLTSSTQTVFAASSNSYSKNYVDDGADLLSDSEELKLNDTLGTYSVKNDIDMVVLTRDGLDGKSDKIYLQDYVDSVCDADIYSEDITVLLCDMSGRIITIQAYGSCEDVINDDNIEYILDVVTPQLSEGAYYNAFEDFANGVNHYYDNTEYEYGVSQYTANGTEPIYLKTWFQLVIALVIGGITAGVLVINSGGKTTTNNHTYLDEAHSGLVAKRDIYIRTSISKVRKPTNNGGGRSSGGGGVSAGGRSHSGGSRGF